MSGWGHRKGGLGRRGVSGGSSSKIIHAYTIFFLAPAAVPIDNIKTGNELTQAMKSVVFLLHFFSSCLTPSSLPFFRARSFYCFCNAFFHALCLHTQSTKSSRFDSTSTACGSPLMAHQNAARAVCSHTQSTKSSCFGSTSTA